MSEYRLEVKNLHKRFPGVYAVKGVSFQIKPGENDREMVRQSVDILKEYKMDFDPRTKVRNLSVAQIQMLEIIKAVRKEADIIIMDEPTSSLSDEESRKLFEIIRQLTAKQVSIIYISHRLEEILMLADQITVLRDGEYIKTVAADNVTQGELIEMMVGRSLDQVYPKEEVPQGDVVFEVRNLCHRGVFENISFQVRAGEILGFSGLVGAGRSEIMNAIFGIDKLDSGEILVEGKPVKITCPKDAIENKIGLVSEDRKIYGLVLCRSIKENISLPTLPTLHKEPFIFGGKEKEEVSRYRDALDIKCSSIDVGAGTLSGGNQQKVVLAKWLLADPKVLILDEPTRGIDVGAKYEIYKMMVDLARRGIAIIMISSELPEVMGMSDRIHVVSKGKITSTVLRSEIQSGAITQNNILNSALQEV